MNMKKPLKQITVETRLTIGQHMHVVKSERHERSGANLILASLDPARTAGDDCWIADWIAPWQARIKTKDVVFYDEKDAARRFRTLRNENPPVISRLRRDWQRASVYSWEDETLDQHPVALSEPQMQNVVAHIAQRFNMSAPPIRITPVAEGTEPSCYYSFARHEILMAETKCYLSWLLHEMAHAIDNKVNHNDWSYHGPSFVRTLLALNTHYQSWHDVGAAETLARKRGLLIADTRALPDLQDVLRL